MALNPYLPAEVTLELAKAFFKALSPRYRCLFKALDDKYPGQEQRRGDGRLQLPPTSLPLPSPRPMGLCFYLFGSDPCHTGMLILPEKF